MFILKDTEYFTVCKSGFSVVHSTVSSWMAMNRLFVVTLYVNKKLRIGWWAFRLLAYLAGYNLFNDMDGWLNTMLFYFFCLSTLNQSFEINACGDSADKNMKRVSQKWYQSHVAVLLLLLFPGGLPHVLATWGTGSVNLSENKRDYVGRECICRPLERKQTPHLLPAHSNRMPDASRSSNRQVEPHN